jgi:hypothetical protein
LKSSWFLLIYISITVDCPSYDYFSLFHSQLEETISQQFEKIVREDELNLAKNLAAEPLIPENYVETWQIQVWKEAFQSFFRGTDAFSKTKSFKNHKFTDLAVKRVLFR